MLRIVAFARALRDFVSDGCSLVSADEYRQRLKSCETCPKRVGLRCGLCGCLIHLKASAKVFQCPDEPTRWP